MLFAIKHNSGLYLVTEGNDSLTIGTPIGEARAIARESVILRYCDNLDQVADYFVNHRFYNDQLIVLDDAESNDYRNSQILYKVFGFRWASLRYGYPMVAVHSSWDEVAGRFYHLPSVYRYRIRKIGHQRPPRRRPSSSRGSRRASRRSE